MSRSSADPVPYSSPSINRVASKTDGLSKRLGKQGELTEKGPAVEDREGSIEEGLKPVYDHTHRKLKPRHVQLIGIGGVIGTALYVQIGQPLAKGGPGSLFIAFTIW